MLRCSISCLACFSWQKIVTSDDNRQVCATKISCQVSVLIALIAMLGRGNSAVFFVFCRWNMLTSVGRTRRAVVLEGCESEREVGEHGSRAVKLRNRF